jgi:U3 small nucleolar RNA-associated protein MPP10
MPRQRAEPEAMQQSIPSDNEDDGAELTDCAQSLVDLTAKPEDFFQPDPERAESFTALLKWLFDYAKSCELDGGAFRKPLGPLEELHVQGFDVDSVWEELQLRNGPLIKNLKRMTATLSASDDISLAAELPLGPDAADSDDAGEMDADSQHDGSSDEEDALEAALDAAGAAAGGSDDSDGDYDDADIDDELEDSSSSAPKRRSKKSSSSTTVRKGRSNRVGFFDWDDMERVADEGVLEEDDELGDDVLDEIYGSGTSGSATKAEGDSATFKDFFTDDDYAEYEGEWAGPEDADSDDAGVDEDPDADFDDDMNAAADSGSDNDDAEAAAERGERMDVDDNDSDNDSGADSDGSSKQQPAAAAATAHGRAKQKMQSKISELEEELLRERPWALRGEVRKYSNYSVAAAAAAAAAAVVGCCWCTQHHSIRVLQQQQQQLYTAV